MRWVGPQHLGFYPIKLRHHDRQAPSQADWLRIVRVEGEETTREAIGGVLAIPRDSVTMDISVRDPNHTQSLPSLLLTPP